MAGKAKYRVAEGTQVHHEGTTYEGGAAVPSGVEDDVIEFWTNAGWIEPA